MNHYTATIVCDSCLLTSTKGETCEHIHHALDSVRNRIKQEGWANGLGGDFCPKCVAQAIQKGQTQ